VKSEILKGEPKVLILLAVYNGKEWLDQQVSSILSQENVSLGFYISDDNSSDGSQDYLKNLIIDNIELNIIYKDTGSGSAGQNFFSMIRECDSSKYDYVAFSDQDDIWLPNKLSSGINLLEASKASGYSSSVTAFWPSGNEKKLNQSGILRENDYIFEGAGQGCTFILKNEFFIRAQSFCRKNRDLTNEFYYHDWLIYILARTWGKEWIFDTSSYIKYRQHSLNDTGARKGIKAIKHRIKLISNGWYKEQIEIALRIAKSASTNPSRLSFLNDIFDKNKTSWRRIKLLFYVYRNGRRKLSDRFMLVFAIVVGWL
jgi:rhamnosyltransferase